MACHPDALAARAVASGRLGCGTDGAHASSVVVVSFDADVIIIGSGFGGSVSALRLAEKGYSVLVLEAGRRFGPGDFA